jgi:catechol 2,3-dioxygenase-like lactoylglutathione lyase family enzyme
MGRRLFTKDIEAMFSHVVVGTNDLKKAKRFYDAVLGALGYGEGLSDDNDKRRRFVYRADTALFIITQPIDGQPATPAGRPGRSTGGMPNITAVIFLFIYERRRLFQ